MRIQLFYPPTTKRGRNPNWNYPPLGLLYLAAYVRQRHPDIEWKVSDGQMDGEDKCLQDFRHFKPDLVGVSFTTPHAARAYDFISKLKEENPKVVVVTGGPHSSALPQEVLSQSRADYVVVGEGEQAFAYIIDAVREGKGDGYGVVTFPPIADIDSIPLPARDLIDLNKYPGWIFGKRGGGTHYTSSRGCPYQCTFCSNPVWKMQKPWCRLRSPQSVVDEIQLLRQEYGVEEFFDQCDEFNADVKHAEAICDEIIRRGLRISWKVQMTARSRHLPEKLIQKMAASGCWLVCLGLESGNQATLDGIGKHIALQEAEHACALLKKHGIKVFGLFMLFTMWGENGQLRYESVEDALRTIEFVRSLRKRKLVDYFSFTTFTPFPGSPAWETATSHGLISEDKMGKWDLWDSSWERVAALPGVSLEDWTQVRGVAGRLQAWSVLTNPGGVNWRALPTLAYRAGRLGMVMAKSALDRIRR